MRHAEKDALSRSSLDAVAAIRKERDVVKAGLIGDLITAPFPEKLPTSLKASRQEVFDSFKRIEADSLKQRQQVDAGYLRALTGLQQSAAGNSELARQIKAESDALLASPMSTTKGGEVEVARRPGKLINGDFTQAGANDSPVAWKLLLGGLENALPQGETFKVVREDNRSLLHTEFQRPNEGFIVTQEVDVPRLAKEAEFKFQVRGKLSAKKKPRVQCRAVDDTGVEVNPNIYFDFEPDPAWKTYAGKMKLTDANTKTTVKKVRIDIGDRLKGVTGYLDYAHVELTFK